MQTATITLVPLRPVVRLMIYTTESLHLSCLYTYQSLKVVTVETGCRFLKRVFEIVQNARSENCQGVCQQNVETSN